MPINIKGCYDDQITFGWSAGWQLLVFRATYFDSSNFLHSEHFLVSYQFWEIGAAFEIGLPSIFHNVILNNLWISCEKGAISSSPSDRSWVSWRKFQMVQVLVFGFSWGQSCLARLVASQTARKCSQILLLVAQFAYYCVRPNKGRATFEKFRDKR